MSIIYDHDQPLSAEDRAKQIHHLALIGIAWSDSVWNVRRINDCYRSLFEVIARLAHEIEDDLDGREDAA